MNNNLSKGFRFLAYTSTILWLCFSTSSSAQIQTQIQCGQVISGSIAVPGEEDRYIFGATAGDVIALINLTSTTANFSPQYQLYDPDGLSIFISISTTTITLAKTGAYTIVISSGSGSSQTGGYAFAFQRTKNPCKAIPIVCATPQAGSIDAVAELDAFTFSDIAGNVITPLLLVSTTANFNSRYQLYDPDGQFIFISISTTTIVLPKTGTYTILVSYNFGSSQTGGYVLAFQRTKNPCNATAIVCATPQSGSIDAVAELDAFTFSGTAGDVITPFLLVSTTANFNSRYQLYDPDGQFIFISISTTTIVLPKSGTYTILVSYNFGSSQTGGYVLAFQRTKNPCNAVPIVCGTPQSGSIDAVAKLDPFIFSGTAGDVITLIRLTSTTANFNSQYQLYDPDGLLIFTSISTTTITLAKTGTYTILVSYNFGSSPTGAYVLVFQRTKNPCNPTQLIDCQSVRASINAPAELDAYVFNGTAGQTVVLRATGDTPSFVPQMELYDPDGILITSSSSTLTQTLSKTGAHTVLVSSASGSSVIGSYTLSLGNIKVILSTPNGGEVFFAGSTVSIVWASVANNPVLASHDIRISTDGGASYPAVIASGLPATAQSFNWNVPTDFIASNARVRIIARDSAGNVCNDDSDGNFVVVGFTPTTGVSYAYDELNRLIKATYADGAAIAYTYDATGNRLSEVVSGACSYAISPTSKTFASSGGTSSVSVTAPSNCSWSATSNANWTTISSGSTGTGNGTTNYSVGANTGPARIGTMTIAGQSFTVNQDSGCTFSINPISQDFAASGGANSVSVSTPNGCSWNAVSNANWIIITSGNTGIGNATVNYSVASNPDNKPRNGTMTVAGKSFTVKQKGK